MKSILSIVLLISAGMSVCYAQTEKGTKTLGLTFSYSSENGTRNVQSSSAAYISEETKQDGLSFGPVFSYFVADKLELGVSAVFSRLNIKQEQDDALNYWSKGSQYNGTVFLRKHFMLADQFGVRTGPYFGYSYASSINKISDDKQTSNIYSAGIDLGLEYFPLRKLGFAANLANLGYTHRSNKYNSEDYGKTDAFGFSLTNSVNLTIFWVFDKK